MDKILIATKNAGKAREYQRMFSKLGISVQTLLDMKDVPVIKETGKTFAENALIKANTLTKKLHIPVLADDSGLVVDALDGAPGIYSARYAGDHDDAANKAKLLRELEGVPDDKRTAHFHCTIVVTKEGSEPLIANGDVEGRILTEERGSDGFGYDPLFFYPPAGKSFAEMDMNEKNAVSHRGRALENLEKNFSDWWDK